MQVICQEGNFAERSLPLQIKYVAVSHVLTQQVCVSVTVPDGMI